MSIQLVTYANQTVTPTNDAIIYERAIDQNGIFYGCNVTVSGNEVHITGGYGIVCGREFTIQSEAITVTLAPSGTLDGRLYVRLDLADADNPIQLLTATGNTLPPLEQDDDVNYTNGTYEMELATFTVGVSALSDVVETFETIVGSKPKYKPYDTQSRYVVVGNVAFMFGRITSGTSSIPASSGTTITVDYPTDFTLAAAPSPVVSLSTGANYPANISLGIGNLTTTGFTVRIQNTATSAQGGAFDWFAIGRIA